MSTCWSVPGRQLLIPCTPHIFFMLLNHRWLPTLKSQEVLHPVALWPRTSRLQVSALPPPGRTILALAYRSRHYHSSSKFIDAGVPSVPASGISVCDGLCNVDMSVHRDKTEWLNDDVGLGVCFFCNIPTALRNLLLVHIPVYGAVLGIYC